MKWIFLLLLFVFACRSQTDGRIEGGQTQSCVCPQVYDPVCGSDGKTYTNACSAQCVDVEFVDGRC